MQVEALMGPGVDPHLYKASPGDVQKLSGADLVLYNGLHLEGKLSDLLVKLAAKRPVVAVTEAMPEARLLHSEDGAAFADPHVWFDIELWSLALSPVADALAKLDPAGADFYRENAEKYKNELLKLHEETKEILSSIPETQRVLITAHDAFRYFGRAYGIEVMGIQGISTESEAGLREINRLVDLLVARGVKAVFVESSVSDRNVKALIEGARRRGAQVSLGGSLFSDAMGELGTETGTYPGMIRHNVGQIFQALR